MALSPDDYPNLSKEGYSEESPETPKYNCIAWAAGDDSVWWEPFRSPYVYWPRRVPYGTTVDVFIALFNHLGYSECDLKRRERGFEKIAIYEKNGQFTHVARQLNTGRWTSKLGKDIDIKHTLKGLEGPGCGNVATIMKREQ